MKKCYISASKLAMFLLSLTILCSTQVLAQAPKQKRATLKQAQELLAKNPELKSGFKSPGNATVQVTKPIAGGFAVKFHSEDGFHGNLTVVGPPTIIADKSIWDTLADIAIAVGKKLLGGDSGGGGSGGSGSGSGGGGNNNNGCVNVNFNGNVGSGAVIIVNGTSCGPS